MKNRKLSAMLAGALAAAMLLMGCAAASSQPAASSSETESVEDTAMKMKIEVNGSLFTATLADNAAADALADWVEEGPVTLELSDYAGFEKVGPLGRSLPASDSQTTHAGDIVLYQGDQIVLFYGSNSWSYTRLGRIDDLTGWEDALGGGDVTITLSLEG